MNIVLLHEKIKSYHDQVGSDRFPTWQIDNAFDTAQRNIVKNRYDKETIRGMDKQYFSKNQQNRDEIGALVKTHNVSSEDFSDNIIPASIIPSDFWIMVDLMVKLTNIDDELYPGFLSYNERKALYSDPYVRPSMSFPYVLYYYRTDAGREIIHGSTNEPTEAKIYYLSKPTKPNYGTEITTSNINDYSLNGEDIIINSEGTVIEGTVYNIGSELTWDNSWTLSSGSFVYNYTDTNLPDLLHEEICRETAILLSGTISDFNKGQYEKSEKMEE